MNEKQKQVDLLRACVCLTSEMPRRSVLIVPLVATLFFVGAVTSVHAACSTGSPLDTTTEHFTAVNRIATDDSVSGASDVTVAGDFTVHYDTYFKVVQTHCGTHQPSGCVPQTYILRLCGGAEPTAYNNGTALPTDSKHFTIPVSGVALPGSTPVTFLEMLGLRDKINSCLPPYHPEHRSDRRLPNQLPAQPARPRIRPVKSQTCRKKIQYTYDRALRRVRPRENPRSRREAARDKKKSNFLYLARSGR
jgi:hypothetical protein